MVLILRLLQKITEEEDLGFVELMNMKGGMSKGDGESSWGNGERAEDDLCSVFSTMEDFEGDGKMPIEDSKDETRVTNMEIVMVEEDAQAIAAVHNLELDELIELSLEGVTLSASDVNYCSQWVVNNVQN